jgi:hypothetical protein
LVRLRFIAVERRSIKELVKSREAMVDQLLQGAMSDDCGTINAREFSGLSHGRDSNY